MDLTISEIMKNGMATGVMKIWTVSTLSGMSDFNARQEKKEVGECFTFF